MRVSSGMFWLLNFGFDVWDFFFVFGVTDGQWPIELYLLCLVFDEDIRISNDFDSYLKCETHETSYVIR